MTLESNELFLCMPISVRPRNVLFLLLILITEYDMWPIRVIVCIGSVN